MSECLGNLLQPYSVWLKQIADLTPDNDQILQMKGGEWTLRSPGQYWNDLMDDPTAGGYSYTELPFTIDNDKRLLGRDSALPPSTAMEIILGPTLAMSSGVLNVDDVPWSVVSATPTTLGGYGITDAQPLDSDLTAIAALTTENYGRGVLTQANASALRTYAGLGDSAVLNAGVALGVATLDIGGKIPSSQLPDSILGQVRYMGTWNATTNTPTLSTTPDPDTKGEYYVVSTGGTFDGIAYAVGDWIISNGTSWDKVDNTDQVTSVAGRIGAITLFQADITGLTTSDSPAFAGVNAPKLTNLTSNGFVKTGSGDGTLSVVSSIGNSDLTNSAITIAGASTSLGGSISLDTITGVSSNGILARTASNTLTNRKITGTANEITVLYGDGADGDPTLSLPSAITLTGKTVTGGTFTGGAFNGTVGATTPAQATVTNLRTGTTTWTGLAFVDNRNSVYIQNPGGSNPGVFMRSSTGAPSQPIFWTFSSRGTDASPEAAKTFDGHLLVTGLYDGSDWQQGTRVESFASEDWSSTNQGTMYSIATTLNGHTVATGRATRFMISGLGNVLIGGVSDLVSGPGRLKAVGIEDTPIGSVTPSTGAFTSVKLGNSNLQTVSFQDTDGSENGFIYMSTENVFRIQQQVPNGVFRLTTNGGAASFEFGDQTGPTYATITPAGINNTAIGATTPSTGAFTTLKAVSLPTSPSGLSSGDIWNDGGTLKIV